MDTRSPIPLRAAPPPPSDPALNVRDIYYILFRHKWKIIVCSLAGIITGTAYNFLHTPPYQSQTKLYIRYVVAGESISMGSGPQETRKSPDMRGETIMDSEMEILMSFDLAKLVATAVGPEKILAKAGGGKDPNNAASTVQRGLKAQVIPRSSVISITFMHPDPEIIQPVLMELVDRYYKKHQEIHQKNSMMNDFMSQETDQLKSKLLLAEEALQKQRNKADIISLEDAKASISRSIINIKEEIGKAQAQLADKQASYAILRRRAGIPLPASATENKAATTPAPAAAVVPATPEAATATATPPQDPVIATTPANVAPVAPVAPSTVAVANATPEPTRTAPEMPPPAVMEEYREVASRVAELQRKELGLMVTYTKEAQQVQDVRAQLEEAKKAKRELEEKYPAFVQANQSVATPASPGAPAAPTTPVLDLGAVEAEIAGLQATIKELNRQFEAVKNEQTKIDENEIALITLQRDRDAYAKQFQSSRESLDQARMKEALNPSKVSNINQIQLPPPPFMDTSKTKKAAGMAIAGGFAAGLAWAFLIEMLLDRSVRRPAEFERSLGLQLFLSIPEDKKLRRNQRTKNKKKRLSLKAGKDQPTSTGESELLAPLDESEGLRPFHETLRDRLIGYFERRNLTHKPKLIAVTGIGSGAGVTTTTAGLARALSETGDGNVLVVDMTPGQGTALQFSRGKEVQGLESMLETRQTTAPVQDNLYLVTESTNGDKLSRILPQRFSKLLPKLKSSDFDYIIFDMPAVSQISITPRLAEFMDMVLLVVESEKTDRETVQRAAALLAETKAHVGALLNKTRNYVPGWLHQEHMGNA